MLNHPNPRAQFLPPPAAPPISPVQTQAARISSADLADTRAAVAPWDRASEAMKNGPHSDDGLKVKGTQFEVSTWAQRSAYH
ncbi:hypothetical protein ZWY2020_021810 [Hordeum vulgare]|nr:hypothetical protein ZWY2020_021810 [Hordeum vulgare]